MAISIDRVEMLRLIETEGAQIVDVLPEREYADSHLPGAISLPLRDLDENTASVLRRDKPVVVY